MADLYKYGVAVHIYKPIIKRGVVDFAVGADWTPAAGDVKISKDGGAASNVTNLPTAITMGNTAMWDYSITATEMQAAKIRISVADSETKAVEDQFFEIDTYGHASAQHAVDLSDTVRAGLTALPNVAMPDFQKGVLRSGSNTTTLQLADNTIVARGNLAVVKNASNQLECRIIDTFTNSGASSTTVALASGDTFTTSHGAGATFWIFPGIGIVPTDASSLATAAVLAAVQAYLTARAGAGLSFAADHQYIIGDAVTATGNPDDGTGKYTTV